MGEIVIAQALAAKRCRARVPRERAIPGARSKINRFHAVFAKFKSPATRCRARCVVLRDAQSKIRREHCDRMTGGREAARERTDLDRWSALLEKRVVGLSHMQKAHRDKRVAPAFVWAIRMLQRASLRVHVRRGTRPAQARANRAAGSKHFLAANYTPARDSRAVSLAITVVRKEHRRGFAAG